ncbi:PIN domain-containing protein [Candidatus Pyrohabitans sp.]
MLLVVDANIIFSALIKGGKTLDIFILNRRINRFKFIAPEYLMVEVEKHIDEIINKTKLLPEELEKVLDFLEREIEFIPFEDFRDLYEKAEQLSPDPDDVQYFALALKFGGTIWSNDKALKNQPRIQVLSTQELLSVLSEAI